MIRACMPHLAAQVAAIRLYLALANLDVPEAAHGPCWTRPYYELLITDNISTVIVGGLGKCENNLGLNSFRSISGCFSRLNLPSHNMNLEYEPSKSTARRAKE